MYALCDFGPALTWHRNAAGMNKEEDLLLYSYEKTEGMSETAAKELGAKLSDPALQSILKLHIDKPPEKRWITEYQNHRDNLPDDPTQVHWRRIKHAQQALKVLQPLYGTLFH